ncbi:MAG: branched-chain amino acid ABC transporter permease [Archaeoglobaceae archaeon]
MIELVVIGIVNACIYIILASGFGLLVSVSRVLNLAYTAYYMLAAYLLYYLSVAVGLPLWSSVVLSLLGVIVFGLIVDLATKPVLGNRLVYLVVTLIVALLLSKVLYSITGKLSPTFYLLLPSLVPGYIEISNSRIPLQYLLSLGAAVMVLIIFWFIEYKTSLGLLLRASASDRELANLLGINEKKIILFSNTLATLLAGIAGVIIAPMYAIEATMWLHPLLILLAITILGGIGSFSGSLVAAVLFATIETGVVIITPEASFLREPVAMAAALLFLLFKPTGIRGVEVGGE